MSSPSPELKSNDLIDRLNHAPSGDGRDFYLRKLATEAKALIKVDAASGYMILGMINSDLGKADECRSNFKKAQDLSSALLIRRNFASALLKLAHIEEATNLAVNNVQSAESDIEVLYEGVHACLYSGRLTEAAEYATRLSDMNVHRDLIDEVQMIMDVPDDARESFPNLCSAVAGVFTKHLMFLSARSAAKIGSQVVLRYLLDAEPEKIAEVNMDIADALAEVDPYVGQYYIFICMPLTE